MSQQSKVNGGMPPTEIISQKESLYPQALGAILKDKAPLKLYCKGNIDLITHAGVGFCGSRKPSEKGIETAIDCATQITTKGVNVISGNAAGVDEASHYTALVNRGVTIIVLPEGINHFRIKKRFSDVWDWERVLVISHFNPDDPWRVYRAMERNWIIAGLSSAMLVIEAREKGGTLSAGLAALEIGMPLFVAFYGETREGNQGNMALLERGGIRLGKNRMSGRANLANLFDQIKKFSLDDLKINRQLNLLENTE